MTRGRLYRGTKEEEHKTPFCINEVMEHRQQSDAVERPARLATLLRADIRAVVGPRFSPACIAVWRAVVLEAFRSFPPGKMTLILSSSIAKAEESFRRTSASDACSSSRMTMRCSKPLKLASNVLSMITDLQTPRPIAIAIAKIPLREWEVPTR